MTSVLLLSSNNNNTTTRQTKGTNNNIINNNNIMARTPSPPSYFRPAPAEISHGPYRFLITDRPNDMSINDYLQQLKKHNVTVVVRVCEATYKTEPLTKNGIQVLDWEFPDGSPPPKETRDKWIQLVKDTFKDVSSTTSNPPCIAVHCVAGLGRAPVMVSLALMECGMKYETAVETIRERRRGAINAKQLAYLEKYKATGELKKGIQKKNDKDCSIM